MNLHNHIHRVHYARHVVASMLSQRSLSPPHSPSQQLLKIGDSPSRASAAAETAACAASATAERPLPDQTHRHPLQSAAAEPRHPGAEAAEVPHVKRQLLNGMRMDQPCVRPSAANSHPYTAPGLSSAAGSRHSASQHQALHSSTLSDTARPQESAAAAAAAMVGLPHPSADSERLSVPAENGVQETQHHQQVATAHVGAAPQQAGPGSAKAFLSGIRPDPAPWDDVDPALSKERAALDRY